MTDYRGQRFGNYQLIEWLGKGGFAQVYLGEQIYLKTRAAIKVMNTPLEDEKVEQFRFEAGIIANLDHPHIVRLLDYGVEKNIPYLVMQYAPNGTLRQRHPHGSQVPLTLVVRYVQQVAAALDYAHRQRIIHRDVKPENLLLGRTNNVLLSDFGIAVIAHQSTNSMSTQDGVGTIHYVAPEQLRRKPRPASDQYALAAVVYEWLTGHTLFQGSPIEIAMQHLAVPPPPMREPGSLFSADVERVVLRALEKHWQMRYPSLREFAIALQEAHSPRPPFTRWSSGDPPSASPAEIDPRDLAPTAEPPAPAMTPRFPENLPDDIAEMETQKLGRPGPAGASVGAPVPGDPKGEQPTDPPTRLTASSRHPEIRRARPRHLTHRTALLAVVALLMIAALGAGGWLLTLGSFHPAASLVSGTTTHPTQQSQPGVTPSPGASAIPTGIPSATPGTPAAQGTTPTPPETTPTATPSGSPTATTTPPDLSVSPPSLTFSLHLVGCVLNNKAKRLTIQNTGGGDLSWQATTQNGYVTLNKTGGTLGPGETDFVEVTANCPAGNKSDTITFSWSSGGLNVPVTIAAI